MTKDLSGPTFQPGMDYTTMQQIQQPGYQVGAGVGEPFRFPELQTQYGQTGGQTTGAVRNRYHLGNYHLNAPNLRFGTNPPAYAYNPANRAIPGSYQERLDLQISFPSRGQPTQTISYRSYIPGGRDASQGLNALTMGAQPRLSASPTGFPQTAPQATPTPPPGRESVVPRYSPIVTGLQYPGARATTPGMPNFVGGLQGSPTVERTVDAGQRTAALRSAGLLTRKGQGPRQPGRADDTDRAGGKGDKARPQDLARDARSGQLTAALGPVGQKEGGTVSKRSDRETTTDRTGGRTAGIGDESKQPKIVARVRDGDVMGEQFRPGTDQTGAIGRKRGGHSAHVENYYAYTTENFERAIV